jgi:uncharacterized protein (DUF58 family)
MFRTNSRRRIDPTKDTQFSDAWIIIAIALTVAGVALNSRYLTGAAALLLAIAGVAWIWARVSLAGVSYERTFSEIRAFRGETVELALSVRNRKPVPLTWLTIRDTFPQELPVAEKDLVANPVTNLADFSTFWMIGPYQRITRRYEVECVERGFHSYGPVEAQTGDGFGFFSRRTLFADVQRLIIYPHLYSVTELRLPSKNPFGEARGSGRLFEDPLRTVGIRAWQESDSPRRVHWKATARQQTLLSRVYEPSEEQQVMLFLNVATLERHWHGYLPELQERTISVAGSLAALAAELRLPVGLIANGALPGSDQPLRLLPGRGPNQLVRILELLAAVTPFATGPIETMLLHEAPRMPWGATLVVVTAIAHNDLLATITDLAAAGRKVVLFTLAKEPPATLMPGVTIYHLPHLIDDLITPALVQEA